MASDYPAFAVDPSFVQGHWGKKGNFELVVVNAYGGLVHISRNNDVSSFPWSPPTRFGKNVGQIFGVSLIEGNYGAPGNLEVVVNAGGRLQHLYRASSNLGWNGPLQVSPSFQVTGIPSLIQSKFGKRGNFELVAPAATGGLVHFWRNNDASGNPWSPPTQFGQGLGAVTSVSLIQSNYGKGNLEVIAIAKAKLHFIYYESGWRPPITIEADYEVTGNPTLIQSSFGKHGNFELVVPSASGGLLHFWRDNNDGTKLPTWSNGVRFGQSLGIVTGASLFQSNFDNGNLEVVALKDGVLYHFYRTGNTWNGPNRVAPSG